MPFCRGSHRHVDSILSCLRRHYPVRLPHPRAILVRDSGHFLRGYMMPWTAPACLHTLVPHSFGVCAGASVVPAVPQVQPLPPRLRSWLPGSSCLGGELLLGFIRCPSSLPIPLPVGGFPFPIGNTCPPVKDIPPTGRYCLCSPARNDPSTGKLFPLAGTNLPVGNVCFPARDIFLTGPYCLCCPAGNDLLAGKLCLWLPTRSKLSTGLSIAPSDRHRLS